MFRESFPAVFRPPGAILDHLCEGIASLVVRSDELCRKRVGIVVNHSGQLLMQT
jgi:hypothetical protein